MAGQGRGRGSLSDKQGQGPARAGQGGKVGAGQAFTDRPSDDRVQIITVFTNCH